MDDESEPYPEPLDLEWSHLNPAERDIAQRRQPLGAESLCPLSVQPSPRSQILDPRLDETARLIEQVERQELEDRANLKRASNEELPAIGCLADVPCVVVVVIESNQFRGIVRQSEVSCIEARSDSGWVWA